LFVICALLITSQSAVAVPIYTQPSAGLATNAGWNSNLPATSSVQEIADDFVLGSGATVEQIDWYGQTHDGAAFNSGAIVPFRVRFFADAGGTPNVNPFFDTTLNVTAQAAPGDGNIFGDPNLFWSTNLAGPSLAAGTVYWLSILEADATTSGTWAWAINPSLPFGVVSRSGEGGSWSGPFESVVYTLHAVPEPTTLAFLSLGMAGIVLSQKRGG
jgi:hypothetical protein